MIGTTALGITRENVDEFFKRKKVQQVYQTVRSTERVKDYYDRMIKRIKRDNKENVLVEHLLEEPEVLKDNENIIKTALINQAILNLVLQDKDASFEESVISIITEDNLLEAIDELEEMTRETIGDFCEKFHL